jgi:hypothetical protein
LKPPPARISLSAIAISRETPSDARTALVTGPSASRTIFSSDAPVRMSTSRRISEYSSRPTSALPITSRVPRAWLSR